MCYYSNRDSGCHEKELSRFVSTYQLGILINRNNPTHLRMSFSINRAINQIICIIE